MLIQQVDPVCPEPLERSLDAPLDRLRATVETAAVLAVEVESELGGDHDLVADRLQGFPDQLFVREWPVHLSGVEERHATLDGRPGQLDHLVPVRNRQVALAHPHAAEPDCRDLQPAVSERALHHRFLLCIRHGGVTEAPIARA